MKKTEQVLKNGKIVIDYDQTLTTKEIRNLFFDLFESKIKQDGKQYVLYNKIAILPCNVTYLGNPHPIYKKRIQLKSYYPEYLEKNSANNIKTMYVGIYTYNKTRLFVVFEPDTYANKKSHNSSAHVFTINLQYAQRAGKFDKIDGFGNKIHVFNTNEFIRYIKTLASDSTYVGLDSLMELINDYISSFGRTIPKEWKGIDCYNEMLAANDNNARQGEWPGWYFEYLFKKYLANTNSTKIKWCNSKEKGGVDLDVKESTISVLSDGQIVVTAGARELNAATNGGFFNSDDADIPQVIEYDLNLKNVFDKVFDLPEVQQDMCPVNIFDATTKNIGGRVATEINASTIAEQLANRYNAAKAATAWTDIAVVLPTTGGFYAAIQNASTMLDDGDEANGIQAFPFSEREIIMRPSFRGSLLTDKGILVGGSNYAQSMLAKGAVSPEAQKEWGNMYCGEIDLIPCYIAPSALWKRAGEWAGSADAFDAAQAMVCAASATDRGISTQDYIKVIDSPGGAGKRLQPKTRWGINVCYGKGIIPILKNGTSAPSTDLTILAPGSKS